MAIKLFGDSHLNAIQRAAEGKDWAFHWASGRHLPQMTFAEVEGGLRVTIPGDAGETLVDVTLTSRDIGFFSGPFHTSRIARYPAWLTHIPLSMYQGGDAQVVLPEELTAHIDAYYAQAFDFLQAARRLDLSVLVLESPRLLPRVAEFWEGDLAVVAEVDRLVRDHVRDRLRQIPIPVIVTPPHSYDGAWTLPDFASKKQRDVHHGNRRYGMNVLRRIETHIDRLTNRPEGPQP